MGALKIFGSPWLRRRLLFPNNLIAFVPIEPTNVRTKFEVRSFTRSWDNARYPKNLGSPWIRPRSLFSKMFTGLLLGWTLWVWMYWPNLKSAALLFPEIISIGDLGGGWLRTSNVGKGGRRGSEMAPFERTLVTSIGHPSNFSSILTRFRDIAAFVLQHTTFSDPTSSLPKIYLCSPGSRWTAFGLRTAKVLC